MAYAVTDDWLYPWFRGNNLLWYAVEVAQDLPLVLYERLEDDAYGRRYLEKLDEQLLQRIR